MKSGLLPRGLPLIYLLVTALILTTCGTPPVPCRQDCCGEHREEIAPEPADRVGGANLIVRNQLLAVEVVREQEERSLGLMFREGLAPDSGMLFVFDSLGMLSFWMKNTLIPLDIAFVNDSGIIVDIQHMAPLDTTTRHVSRAPARYAVEANVGWFAAGGARIGDTIHGIPR